LFDEPLSNLDAKLRMTMRAELKWLHQRLEATSLYVTHDQAEAMTLGDRICIMLDGEIQQVNEPMEIYEQPQNRFVAGFLGTPPMNFLNGKVRFQNEQVYFVVCAEEIGLPESMKEVLISYRDRDMVLGIRPEHLACEPGPNPAHPSIGCTVSTVEPLGDHMDVYLKTAQADQLIAKVNPHHTLQAGQTTRLYMDHNQIHVFEPGPTGKNVGL
jgi:multiple sugar transport system ATP-binding protein